MKIKLQNRKGQMIVGVLEKPIGEIRGTCVLQHGWGGHKDKPTMQVIKDSFLESGFQTFNFDTTNSFGESDGDFEKSTLGLFWEDLEDVVKWVQKQDWFVKPLALSGHSKGGYSVARYAEEHPDEVDYLVPVAPVVSGKLSFEAHKMVDSNELEKWEKEGILERIGTEGDLKRQHWFQMEERLQHDLLPNASKLIMPTLLLVGSDDTSCPPQHIKTLYDAMPTGKKEIVVLEGAPHSYREESAQKDCKNAIKDWLSNPL